MLRSGAAVSRPDIRTGRLTATRLDLLVATWRGSGPPRDWEGPLMRAAGARTIGADLCQDRQTVPSTSSLVWPRCHSPANRGALAPSRLSCDY